MTITDAELQDKIRMFIMKLDKMESRVREVESVASKIPAMEATLSKISSQVGELQSEAPLAEPSQEAPSRKSSLSWGQAMMRGVIMGLVMVGILAAAWMIVG